jgi:hypothetical protein
MTIGDKQGKLNIHIGKLSLFADSTNQGSVKEVALKYDGMTLPLTKRQKSRTLGII